MKHLEIAVNPYTEEEWRDVKDLSERSWPVISLKYPDQYTFEQAVELLRGNHQAEKDRQNEGSN